jgi:hypothetical protein
LPSSISFPYALLSLFCCFCGIKNTKKLTDGGERSERQGKERERDESHALFPLPSVSFSETMGINKDNI